MIDMQNETVVSLTEAAKELPKRRAGKKPHVATLYRWASRGMRGVRLETLQVGGTLCTSLEALQRFFNCLSPNSTSSPTTTIPNRRREVQAAQQKLTGMGL